MGERGRAVTPACSTLPLGAVGFDTRLGFSLFGFWGFFPSFLAVRVTVLSIPTSRFVVTEAWRWARLGQTRVGRPRRASPRGGRGPLNPLKPAPISGCDSPAPSGHGRTLVSTTVRLAFLRTRFIQTYHFYERLKFH